RQVMTILPATLPRPARPPRAVRRAAAGLLAAGAAGLAALAGAPPARADCPGANPVCAYAAAAQVGHRGEGVLRFPQAVAVGPDGMVYVADQGSHVVQVFNPAGQFVREVGISGTGPGQLTSAGAVAVAADGSLFVADGTNRIDRFGPGGGNAAGAGGGLAAAGPFVYVADTGNDRIQRFSLTGDAPRVLVPPG